MQYKDISTKRRYLVSIMGVVQGVGFRPYVYNQAKSFHIRGWVSNQGGALIFDIEGESLDIKGFLLKVIKEPPSLAIIEKVSIIPKEPVGYKTFDIKNSTSSKGEIIFISPDIATCEDCLQDISDSSNPRYEYTFTNCTNCGPRYSIIKRLPYDRASTTMESFGMCSTCEREYHHSENRRFHAQPNCCPKCGPSLKLLDSKGRDLICENPVRQAIHLMKQGKIGIIKGIGGFHLACDGQNQRAVEVLRNRKKRPHKPFAIMVKDIQTARKVAYINKEEEDILRSNKRPIVLLNKKESSILPDIVAPYNKKIGIMLPYTPLHHMLFQEDLSFFVMTSGNVSGGPIQFENEKGMKELKNMGDFFLIHNRQINMPVEDSVVKVMDKQEFVIRRGRGYAPYILNMKAGHEIIALGSEQKNTFCLSKNGYGYMSQYLGDLNHYDAYLTYEKVIEFLTHLLNIKPKKIAHDLNWSFTYPQYKNVEEYSIQHHHAHMVSCMVEHKLFTPTIGVIFDGTGLGNDGTIWGGEFLIGNRKGFTRAGHLKDITIQGKEQAIKEPWRVALSYLHAINDDIKKVIIGIDEEKIEGVTQALDKHINCYKTSSMGRFFDCVVSLLNIRHVISYDAQGAIELENSIAPFIKESYEYHIIYKNAIYVIEYESIILGILDDVDKGIDVSIISTKFHNTIKDATVDLVCMMSERYGIKQVVLSGGVFQNGYLLKHTIEGLRGRGPSVFYNQQIPINDSGISIGQLAIADAMGGDE